MLCKECGSQIPDDAVECEFCGAMVDASASDDTRVINSEELAAAAGMAASAMGEEIFDENEKKRREQMEKMMADKKKQLSEIEKRRNEKRRKQKQKKFAIIALICVIVAGGAGAGAYYMFQSSGSQPVEQTLPVASPSASPLASPSASPSASPTVSMSPLPASASPAVQGQAAVSPQVGTAGQASSNGKSSSSTSQKTTSNASSNSSPKGSSSSGSKTSSSSGSASSGSSASSQVVNSGIVSDKISAKIVTGGEVIYNTGTGRYLMTFTMGGTRYYANVSEGSTTEQIHGKTYTIDADATKESYNGNTVYEISSMTNYAGDYVLPSSGTKLLTDSDLKGLSKYDLALARNEIYARHGRKFQTPEYSAYFSGKSWYKLNPNYNYANDDSNLNDIERKNVLFILKAEKR